MANSFSNSANIQLAETTGATLVNYDHNGTGIFDREAQVRTEAGQGIFYFENSEDSSYLYLVDGTGEYITSQDDRVIRQYTYGGMDVMECVQDSGFLYRAFVVCGGELIAEWPTCPTYAAALAELDAYNIESDNDN